MDVNCQFHALDRVPWGKCDTVTSEEETGWATEAFGKSKICCIYQDHTPDISAHTVNTVLLFIIADLV
jgi:hypothetical protein